jgi:hypothetical protein
LRSPISAITLTSAVTGQGAEQSTLAHSGAPENADALSFAEREKVVDGSPARYQPLRYMFAVHGAGWRGIEIVARLTAYWRAAVHRLAKAIQYAPK